MILENIEVIRTQLDPFDEGVKFYSKCDTELSVSIFICLLHLLDKLILGYFFLGLDVID